jgi:hypothetical protein
MQIRAERPDEYPRRQRLTVDEAPWSRPMPSEQAAFLRASIERLAATGRIESAAARFLLVSTG